MATNRMRWDEIAGNLLDLADEEVLQIGLPEVLQGDAVALRSATMSFLANIKECYSKIMRFNELKKAEHNIRKYEKGESKLSASNVQQLREHVATYKELKIQEEEFNFFMSQLGKYQQCLNNYLGKEIQTLYLYKGPNGTMEVYRLVGDVSKAVYQDIASRGAGLAARFSTRAIEDSTVFEKMRTASKDTQNGEGYLTSTYLETLRRGEISREYLKKNGMLILWKPAGVWKKMMVAGGAGDLGESYLSFLMSEERTNLFKGNMEPDIDIFMLQGVALVDNISGVLKGDFSIGDIDYAAKAEGASMMGYRQVINLALEIAASTPDHVVQIMKREYGKILKQEQSGKGRRNKLIDSLDGLEDELLQEIEKGINSH